MSLDFSLEGAGNADNEKIRAEMTKNVLTVGFELASASTKFEEFTSKASLLDWDVVLFRPSIDRFMNTTRRIMENLV